MKVLVTYDVSTVDHAGRRRLTRVAKTCLDYGQRVQNSVFECIIDPARMKQLQAALEKIIDPVHALPGHNESRQIVGWSSRRHLQNR